MELAQDALASHRLAGRTVVTVVTVAELTDETLLMPTRDMFTGVPLATRAGRDPTERVGAASARVGGQSDEFTHRGSGRGRAR